MERGREGEGGRGGEGDEGGGEGGKGRDNNTKLLHKTARSETMATESAPSSLFLGDVAGYVVGRAPVVSPAFEALRDRVANALGHVVYVEDWTRVVGHSGKHGAAAYNEVRSRTLLMDGWRTKL